MTKPWLDRAISANERAVLVNFGDWFGCSKAVDDKGLPLVAYHGANSAIEAFDPARTAENFHYAKRGFFFSQSPRAAAEYAIDRAGAFMASPAIPGLFKGSPANLGDGTANVMAVYLCIERPLEVRVRGYRSPEQWFDHKCIELYEKAEKLGADGIIVRALAGSGFEGRALYVAFDACQIKSAIGNSGLYLKQSASLTDGQADRDLRLSFKALACIASRSARTLETCP